MKDIQWCDEVWNPVVGCTRVSRGCDNCYAIRVAARNMSPAHVGLTKRRPKDAKRPGVDWSGEVRCLPERLWVPLRWRKPRRVFVNSMSDLFHESVPFEFVAAVFGVMAAAWEHTFLVLTKRPERALEFFGWYEGSSGAGCSPVAAIYAAAEHLGGIPAFPPWGDLWPLPNVQIGVSAEDDPTFRKRVPLLAKIPAAVRWVSAEPLLGEIHEPLHELASLIDWLVLGGESGPGARRCDMFWIEEAICTAKAAGVPVFVKQLGSNPFSGSIKVALSDSKGGDWSWWRPGLRVRETVQAYCDGHLEVSRQQQGRHRDA